MSRLPAFLEEAIERAHDRKGFDCGDAALNEFLARYARQAHESGSAKTYCAVAAAGGRTIFGFYTISPGQIELNRVPLAARPSGGGRHALGGFRLARLAVARSIQGQGLGGQLLVSAVERCMRVSDEVGGTALLIDAKDNAAAGWYETFGAVRLEDQPLSLVMSYAKFKKARAAAG